ncbi:MAG TPA: SDR family oxidoreductase [Gaiellaceae bacterium]|nr:SDR family oxidoreductase [Gaiellaceae bacterium]
MGRLEGRRALITGASGGLGSAIARSFAGEGARLVLAGGSADHLAQLESPGAETLAFDVADPRTAHEGVDRAAELLGGLDCLVAAAAVDCEWARVGDMTVETWDETIRTNLSGTFYVCRAALPHLITAGGGSIVTLTSVAAYRVWPHDAAYNASKAGVDMLTRTIAVEYGEHGIRANCISPGVIDGGMTDAVQDGDERARLARMHAIPRLGLVEEVAEAAVWLASDASSFTSGSVLRVDGAFLDYSSSGG